MEPWFIAAETVALPPLKLWFTWHFEGLEHIPPEGPAIIACNHVSYLDPLANAYAIVKRGRRPRFLAKEDLFRIPIVSSALRGSGQVPVDRGKPGDPSPLLAAKAALRRDELVVIYPEGTVTKNPDFTPMKGKTGVVRLSLASGVPIVPMASWGSQAVWQKAGKGSLRFGRPVWVKAGPPMDLSSDVDRRDDVATLDRLTDSVMSEISAIVEDLRGRYPKRWS